MGIQNTHFLNAMIYSICVLKSVPLIDTWGGYPHFRQQIHLILVIDHHGIFSNIAKSTGQWTVVIHIPTSSLNVCTASWKTIKKKKNRLTYAGFSDWRRGPNSPYLPLPSVISSAVHSSVGLSWTGTDHQKSASSSVKWGWKKWKH